MANIGIIGPNTLFTIGSKAEVEQAFVVLVEALEGGKRGARFPLVADKLYRRLIVRDDLPALAKEVAEIRSCLDAGQAPVSKLPRLLDGIDQAMASAAFWIEAQFKDPIHILVGRVDMGDFQRDEWRVTQLLPNYDGPPIWHD